MTTQRRSWIAVGVIVLALGFLVFRGLGNATVYFKTVDEAVAQRHDLGTHRFRIEGTVVTTPESGSFTIKGDRAHADVAYEGEVPALMQVGVPVVLEGRWDGDRFAGDRIMVKHTSAYREENPDRVKDYSSTP